MLLIVVSLLAGVVLGAANVVPGSWLRHLDKSVTITLFIMLLALGAQIGSNGELVANLPALGGQALIISAFSIIGSVLVLWLLAMNWKAIREREEV
ncbi:hypothetical protein SDC9_04005 [bioreactor metagenome]|uniref:DUF340 domain-containing protein n=1 Tax=bioreactor metagenome TaxID=1076179 RepID=A0A644SXP4_9ZZZZ|nr:LysO family transporter [Negativicutes bacterium]